MIYRVCKCCKIDKSREEYKYPNGRVCKSCYREKDRIKHQRLSLTSPGYKQRQEAYHKQYFASKRGREAHRRAIAKYIRTPKGKETRLRNWQTFVDNHPLYNYEYLEQVRHKIVGDLSIDAPTKSGKPFSIFLETVEKNA